MEATATNLSIREDKKPRAASERERRCVALARAVPATVPPGVAATTPRQAGTP